MSHRFPPLAPQEKISPRLMAKALPAPSLPWVDLIIFGALVCLVRLF